MDQRHQEFLETAITSIQKKIPDLIAVVLFGSFGSIYETSESDLDLAILSDSKQSALFLWSLAQEIAISIQKDVDLIDLLSASTVFRYHILSTGSLLLCNDQKKFALFEITAFTSYFYFQETRKEILKDYEKLGK